jgi:hypothetical protein
MSGANSMEARIVTFAAAACLISAVLWVPWYRDGLGSSASVSLGYGLLWSPTYRSMVGANVAWMKVGAALATTAMVWVILQLVLEPFSAVSPSTAGR